MGIECHFSIFICEIICPALYLDTDFFLQSIWNTGISNEFKWKEFGAF